MSFDGQPQYHALLKFLCKATCQHVLCCLAEPYGYIKVSILRNYPTTGIYTHNIEIHSVTYMYQYMN